MQNQRVRCIFNVENSRYQTDTKKDATRKDVTTEFDFDDLEMVSGGGIVSILKKGVDIIKHLFD